METKIRKQTKNCTPFKSITFHCSSFIPSCIYLHILIFTVATELEIQTTFVASDDAALEERASDFVIGTHRMIVLQL